MSTGSASELVEEITFRLQETVEASGVFRQLSRQLRMTSNQLRVPEVSGPPTATIVAESDLIPPDPDPQLSAVTLTARKAGTRVILSDELAEDGTEFVERMTASVGHALALAEDTYSLGVVSANATNQATVASASAATLDDLTSMIRTTRALQSSSPMTWLCNQEGLASLIDAVGGNHAADGTFLNFPVAFTAAFPSAPTSGQPLIALGHWEEVSFFGRRRLQAKLINETPLATSGQLELVGTSRFDFQLGVREDLGLSVLNIA